MARRTKQEADETREALLDAAEEVFLERGVSRASLDQVARAAGCTRGAVHWHFGDKLGLFLALDERLLLYQDEACQMLDGDGGCEPTSMPQMFQWIGDAMERLERDPHRRRLLTVMLQRCEYVQEMAPALDRRRNADMAMRERLLGFFQRAEARGEISPAWQPDQAARFLHALISGLLTEWLNSGGQFSLSAQVRESLGLFLNCLCGVAQRETAKVASPTC
ncbi:TetR family transcriptional regulator [Roseomonas aerophila]|uniref:TetR family transcriptional regulator n=1 Tax=Teichococcus aerophilus TaxID=1224513 RepID=A0ABR7RTX2_9PROT|nr:TetR family transcriptional regulator [Pseudoroseomonas aerophila]MBC9209783.1 TetR family transcriptional regulator [Pseudoroseomonas aerophila]